MFESFLKNHSFLEYDFSHPIFPDWRDRDYWDKFPKSACVPCAERFLDYTWPAIKASDFMEFKRSGNRVIMEDIHFERRLALVSLALAELAENKGRFLKQLVNGLFAICEETYWGLSAHWYLDVGNIPSPETPFVDLFAAETAEHIAIIYQTLYGPLQDYCPEILRRIEYEMPRHIMTPYLTHRDYIWMGYFRSKSNNWNPWILSNLMTVFLIMEPNKERLSLAFEKMFREIQHYVNSLPADGGCDEGPGYWSRAGAAVFEFAYQLKEASGGKLDLFGSEKLENIALYVKKVHLVADRFVNFADANAGGMAGLMPMVFGFGKSIGSRELMNFAASVYRSNVNTSVDPTNLGGSHHSFRRSIYNWNWRMEILEFPCTDPLHGELEYLPDLQVATLREGAYTLCAKGGNNAESHNHNDVGSFVLCFENEPVLIDVGINTYTRQTFSAQRYEVIPWVKSDNHNLPVINGFAQKNGASFAADLFTAEKGRIAVSFGNTYPVEAGVKKVEREISLTSQGLILTDSFSFEGEADGAVCEHFMTVLPTVLEVDCAILDGRYRLKAEGCDFHLEKLMFEDAKLSSNWKTDGVFRIEITPKESRRVKVVFEKI